MPHPCCISAADGEEGVAGDGSGGCGAPVGGEGGVGAPPFGGKTGGMGHEAGGIGEPIGRGIGEPLGLNNLKEVAWMELEGTFEEKTYIVVPKSIPDEHWPRSEEPQVGVVLLRQQLQFVGVLPLPLGAPILEPNLDLEAKPHVGWDLGTWEGRGWELWPPSEGHLSLRQLQLLRELHPLRDREVLVLLELRLEGLDLGGSEGGARPLLPVVTSLVIL